MSNRIKYIDIARGLAMLTVLWGHVMLSGKTNIFVYAFHIPTFFFLSGTVYKKEKYPSLLSLIKGRFFTLLVPYCLYSFGTWGYWVLDQYTKGKSLTNCSEPLWETLIARGSAGYMTHNPALWFVTCLFVVEILYHFICKLPLLLNLSVSGLLAFLASYMMTAKGPIDFTALPWNIEVACAAVIFYSLGNCFARTLSGAAALARERRIPLLLATILSGVLLYFGSMQNAIDPEKGSMKPVSMAQCHLGENTTLFYITAVFGIVFVLCACLFLESLYGKSKPFDRMLDYLMWIGKNSFKFMALHIPCMLFFIRVVAYASHRSIADVRDDYFYTVPIWIGMVLGCTLLTYLINKQKQRKKEKAPPRP